MNLFSRTIFALLLISTYCSAHGGKGVTIKGSLGEDKYSVYVSSCLSSLSSFTFGYGSSSSSSSSSSNGSSSSHGHSKRRQDTSSYSTYCNYPPALGTFLICAHQVVEDLDGSISNSTAKKIYQHVNSSCESYTTTQHDWTYYRDQYENATEYYIPLDEIDTSKSLYSPTMPNMTSVEDTCKSSLAHSWAYDSGTWFSVGILGYFAFLIFISAIHNFLRKTSFARSINISKFSKMCQKYVIFPSIFPNGKFTQPYGWKYFSILVPNRLQFLCDTLLFGLQVAFYCVDYRAYGNNSNWVRYVADRTGIMSFGKIPLLVLFAGRNNFLLWVTGWSYTTYLHFHKMVSYWMVLDAIIHSVAYTIHDSGNYTNRLKRLYFACGIAATTIGGVILILAFYPFRKLYYEYFLVTHVVLAISFIAMCWYHCRSLGWLEWLIAACCVWFFDRLLRVIRMSGFGFRKATITVVGDKLFKVTVKKPSWWYHSAGTYCYIYFAGWIFWENHPFTCVLEDENICAYIRVKKGVTYRIWNKLLKNNNSLTMRVSLEGPYGGSGISELKKYDEALLIAGGSGAPGILEAAGSVTKGKMVWVAPTLQYVKAYQPLIERANVSLDVYITRESGDAKSCSVHELFDSSDSENLSSQSSEKEPEKEIELGSGKHNICIRYGRPEIGEIIDCTVRNTNSKSVGIMSCGPPVMSDEIRNFIANRVTTWEKSVDYFDEFQIW